MDKTIVECGIGDGDPLELTPRFASERVATRLLEPVGFYDVSPMPKSSNIPCSSTHIYVNLVNVSVAERPCLFLHPRHGDENKDPVQCTQVWQEPNLLKLIPNAPLQPLTAYTVALDLNLRAHGIKVHNADHADLTCVADGLDTVQSHIFAWHFQTGASAPSDALPFMQVPMRSVGDKEVPPLDITRMLLSRPLDTCTKRQLVALKADLNRMVDRVEVAIESIDRKVEIINKRLQANPKRRRESLAANGAKLSRVCVPSSAQTVKRVLA